MSVLQVYYAPRVTEHGAEVSEGDHQVFTNTLTYGRKVDDTPTCEGWTSEETPEGPDVRFGSALAGGTLWTDDFSLFGGCESEARLYCFGVDRESRVIPEPISGRLAFITESGITFSGSGGLEAADRLCAEEAASARLQGSFRALLAEEGASAVSRFDLDGPTWVRPDGVALVETAGDLPGRWIAAPTVTAAGEHARGRNSVWIGAANHGEDGTAESTCNNWNPTEEHDYARTRYVAETFEKIGSTSGGHSESHDYTRLICLQE